MQVLIADKTASECRATLETFSDLTVVEKTGMDAAALCREVASYEGLIVRSATTVTRQIIEAGAKLKVIGRAGAGVDNIDVEAATERGIVVMNTPGGNSSAVAELVLGLMFCLARHIPLADASMKRGEWAKKSLSGTELAGKTLGLLGLGNVGRRVGAAARCLGMKVAACDPYLSAEQAQKLGAQLVDLEQLLGTSDYISVHVPRTKETSGMLNAGAFAKMKDGVYLVNCSRGGIVVEADLLRALESGKVAGAAIDVYDSEPPGDSELVRHPRVVCTPHIGASTAEAQVTVAVMIAEQIGAYLTRGEISNAVNR